MADVTIGTHARMGWRRGKAYAARSVAGEHKHRVSISVASAQCCLPNSSRYSIWSVPQLFESRPALVSGSLCLPDGWTPGPQWAFYVLFPHGRLNSILRGVNPAFA